MADTKSSNHLPRGMETEVLCHVLIDRFLERQGYSDTLTSFRSEGSSVLSQSPFALSFDDDLSALVQKHLTSNNTSNVKSIDDKISFIEDPLEVASTSGVEIPDKFLPTKVTKTLDDIHAANVLCVRYHVLRRRVFDTSLADYRQEAIPCISTTAADRTIKITSLPSPTHPHYESLCHLSPSPASPALSLAFHPSSQLSHLVFASCMDGSLHLLSTEALDEKGNHEVWKKKDHTKYVVRVEISEDGNWLATVGYDKVLNVYKSRGDLSDGMDKLALEEGTDSESSPSSLPQYDKVYSKTFKTNPEAIIFLPGSKRLAFTIRDDNHLNYLPLPTNDEDNGWNIERYNLNANDDDWVSFSIVSLSIHPSKTHISLQSDTSLSRIILLPINSPTANRAITLFTNAVQSEYSNPRHAWLELPNTGGPLSTISESQIRSSSVVAVSSDDGNIRLVDLGGKIRKSIGAHGASAPAEDQEFDTFQLVNEVRGQGPGQDQEERSRIGLSERVRARRERDMGSSVIRDLVGLPGGGVVSVGFDKTVRIVGIEA